MNLYIAIISILELGKCDFFQFLVHLSGGFKKDEDRIGGSNDGAQSGEEDP